MKKFILFFCVLLLGSSASSAQRYLPGMKGIQASGGIVDGFHGYYTDLKYSRYNRHSNRWVIGLNFLNRNIEDISGKIPVSQFTGEGGYYINFLSDRKKIFFLSMGISALTGYETVNWGKRHLLDGGIIQAKDSFIYGGAVSLEIETYLTDRFVLLLSLRERGLWGNDSDTFHNELGLGLKYIIN